MSLSLRKVVVSAFVAAVSFGVVAHSARATVLSEVGDTFVQNGTMDGTVGNHQLNWNASGFSCENWIFAGTTAGLQDKAGTWHCPAATMQNPPVAYIESADATLTQDVPITTPGRYDVTFRCSSKSATAYGAFTTRILADGIVIAEDVITFTAETAGKWALHTATLDIPYSAVGKALQLQFAGPNAAVDDVQMTLMAASWPNGVYVDSNYEPGLTAGKLTPEEGFTAYASGEPVTASAAPFTAGGIVFSATTYELRTLGADGAWSAPVTHEGNSYSATQGDAAVNLRWIYEATDTSGAGPESYATGNLDDLKPAQNGATVTWRVADFGLNSQYTAIYADYSTTDDFAEKTTVTASARMSDALPKTGTVTLSGLAASTTYFVRLRFVNQVGLETVSSVGTFLTRR